MSRFVAENSDLLPRESGWRETVTSICRSMNCVARP